MFVCGYHFPADMGNKIPNEEVMKKIDADTDMSGAKEIKFYIGKRDSETTEVSYTNMGTALAKACVNYYQKTEAEDGSTQKYLIYTNRYQISALSKELDSDDETMAICKKFDSMEQFRIEVL